MILNESGKWILKSKDGAKTLGTFDSEGEAKQHSAQLLALEQMKGDSVLRMDVGELGKPEKKKNGWLKVDARLTRTGVFTYSNADGSLRRELRLPEEVFKADALDSFAMVPVTDEHPPVFLSSENTRAYARGAAGEKIDRDGKFVRAALMITDASLISKMEDGEAREVSCGYLCNLDHKPGVWNGEAYDAIQRDIRGNHIAIVPRGRAGSEARVRMDAAVAGVVRSEKQDDPRPPPKESSVKITIDGVTYDSEKDSAAFEQAFNKQQKAHADALFEAKKTAEEEAKEKEKMKAKADKAEEDLKKAKADAEGLPAKIRAEATARAALEKKARTILGEKAKLDGKTDAEVRALAMAKAAPDLKLDGKTDAYVEARFDLAVEAAENADEDFSESRRRAQGERDDEEEENEDEGGEGENLDEDEAFEKMRKDQGNLWKKTVKDGAPA